MFFTSITLGPVFENVSVKVTIHEERWKEFKQRYGLRSGREIAEQASSDPEINEELQVLWKHGDELSGFYFLVAQVESWTPLVRLFTFCSIEDAAIRSLQVGRCATFAPGLVQVLVLWGVGGFLLYRARTL